MAPPADQVLTFASAIPLIVLGAALLAIQPRRTQQVLFGATAIVWGTQSAINNIGRILDDPTVHVYGTLVAHAFIPAVYLFLIHFVASLLPRSKGPRLIIPFTLIALASAVVIAVRPDLVLLSVDSLGPGNLRTNFGPLRFPLFVFPLQGAFLLAVIVLYREMRQARPGTQRHRYRGVLIALALYVSYVFWQLGSFFTQTVIQGADTIQFASSGIAILGPSTAVSPMLFFGTGALTLLGIGLHAFLRPPPPEDRDILLLLAFALPAVIALLELVLNGQGIPMETTGFWRFVAVGVLVYTLANYQLFDLDLKLKRFAGPGVATLLGLFAVPVAVAMSLGDFGWQAVILTLIPEIVGIGAVLAFHGKVEEALFPGVKDTPDYVHQRKLELYKVALEDAITRGRGPDDEELAELRLRFAIKDEEHRVLSWMLGGTASPHGSQGSSLVPGSIVLDRYRIEERLGQGTLRATYRALDRKSRRPVAIKTVATAALGGAAARLVLREARLGAIISHPNVLAIFDVAEEPERVLIVMDYASGGNLEDLMRNEGRLEPAVATRLLDELLAALEAIHHRGIIHRNLKPKNVLLGPERRVLISDFSAARAARFDSIGDGVADAGEEAEERAAAMLLDAVYQSPEQVKGLDVGPASDLYVAAVLYHQAATGRFYLPIAGRQDSQIQDLVLNRDPALDSDALPAHMRPVLARALAKDPADRYPDAAAMRAAVAASRK